MIPKRRAIPALVVLGLLTPLLMGSSDLREDQFECEQAVNHLKDCCPADFDPTHVSCEYEEGCGGGATYPSLGVDDSKCIEDKSCDQILASGLCPTVEGLGTYVQDPDGGSPVPPRVCE
jgi:hypothetical protein